MRRLEYDLNVPQANAIGTVFPMDSLINTWVQFGGIFVSTMNVEVTLDGVTWSNVQTVNASGALVEVPPPARGIRINTTGYVSGAPTVKLAGYDARSF